MAGVLDKIEDVRSLFSTYPIVEVRVIHGMNGKPPMGKCATRFQGFNVVREIATLPVRALNEHARENLAKRGLAMLSHMTPGTHLVYEGSLIQDRWFGPQKFRADGRVVIDPVSFRRIDPN